MPISAPSAPNSHDTHIKYEELYQVYNASAPSDIKYGMPIFVHIMPIFVIENLHEVAHDTFAPVT